MALSKFELRGSLIFELLALCRTEIRGSDLLRSSRTGATWFFCLPSLGKVRAVLMPVYGESEQTT